VKDEIRRFPEGRFTEAEALYVAGRILARANGGRVPDSMREWWLSIDAIAPAWLTSESIVFRPEKEKRTVKIIVFEMTESLTEKLAENGVSEILFSPAPGVKLEWSFHPDCNCRSAPVAKPSQAYSAIAEELAGQDGAKEIDITADYVFARTRAPESYDGFGTMTVVPQYAGYRVVAVLKQHALWQEQRYRSGLLEYWPMQVSEVAL